MPSAATNPTPVIDKNGKQTTVHKRVEPKSSVSSARVSAAPVSLASVSSASESEVNLKDDIFNVATINKSSDGFTATGEFTIDDDALDGLRDSIDGDLRSYLKDNSEQIKSIIRAEYGADTVAVHPDDESIVVSYTVPVTSSDEGEVLDALYETRAVTLHSHSYGSDQLSYALDGLGTDDSDSFEPRGFRTAFDDEF
jgi:hypothetical protein